MFGISAFAETPFSALASPSVPGLTGVEASGAVGSVSRGDTSFALSGVAASGSVGTVLGGQALAGVAASGSVGTVIFSAHGVSKAVRAEAESRGLIAYDATCPLVYQKYLIYSRMYILL